MKTPKPQEEEFGANATYRSIRQVIIRPPAPSISGGELLVQTRKIAHRPAYHWLSTLGWCQAGQDKALVTAVGTACTFLCHCP